MAKGTVPVAAFAHHRCWLVAALILVATVITTSAQTGWLDRVDDVLSIQSPDGLVRADLSGLVDLEGYYIDQLPPGSIFSDDDFFFNPRLSLFLDATVGRHIYAFAQFRADRGFDPGSKPDGDARLDEYFVRYTPFDDARLNLQIGKFATVVGTWVGRHDSWNNPFINAPLPYEEILVITDHVAPGSAAAFLGRQRGPANKATWLPVIWGPSYASGASAFGQLGGFEYAVEVKNASLSSRPYAWDATRMDWEYPTFSGRVGVRPNATWRVGASASHGAYLLPQADATLPAGTARGDFSQTTVGADVSYAWRHLQVWGEAFATRFEVPRVGNAESISYYVEARYKIRPKWFGAVRWNQQLFDDVPDGAGGEVPWDRDAWRIDVALGHRPNRHLQGKLQYSYSHQKGAFQQGEQLVAAQLTLKF